MNAHQTYAKIQKETLSGRDIEVRVLRKAAAQFRQAISDTATTDRARQIDGAVRYNLRVWDVFHADWEAPECPLNATLRADLLRLSLYVHKTSLEVLAYGDREKTEALIHINDCLADGLVTGAQAAAPALASV